MPLIAKTLNYNTLAAASPASPPIGYTQTAGSANVNIVNLSGVNYFAGVSSSSNSLWRDDTVLSGATRSAFVTLGVDNANSCGPALLDASNNGYVALTSSGTGNTRLFRIVASQLGTQVGGSVTQTHADNQVREIRWATGGTISLWNGSTQIGTNFSDTTYTPIYAATLSRGGRIRSMTSQYESAFSIDTLTDPLVPGAAVTGTQTGFSDFIMEGNFGGLTVEILPSGPNFSGTMSSFVDGGLCPLLPAAAVSGTFEQGGNAASITRAISVPSGLQELRDGSNAPANFAGLVLGDSKYLGQAFVDGGNPLTTADRVYFNPAFGLKIYQDGKVEINGTDHATNPVPSLPYTTTLWIRRGADGRMYSHTLTIDEESVAVIGQITSVGTVRIGGTTDVTVVGFPAAVNAGTLGGVALTSASDTSITVPSLTDGGSVPRPGIRELELTGGTGTGTTDVLVNPPLGWSSYIVTGGFTQAINGVSSGYLPAGWATGDFILSPNAPSSGKTTTVSDAGVVTNNVGNQELFLVDAATGLATAFDIETTSGAGSIGTGSASEPAMHVIRMETLKMGGLSNPGSTALLLDDTQLLDDTILED